MLLLPENMLHCFHAQNIKLYGIYVGISKKNAIDNNESGHAGFVNGW